MLTDSSSIKITALHKMFAKQRIFNGIDLVLEGGKLQLLSGVNGSGKSTLLRIIAGLERPDSCMVDFGEGATKWLKSKQTLQSRVLYLHQHPYMFDGSVEYNLRFALPRKTGSARRHELIAEAIQWANLGMLLKTPANKLSSGERQRVALARAWLRRPDVLLLDEPTSNMDHLSRRRTLELLDSLKSEGIALLVASHDPTHFAPLTDRHIHIDDGRLIEHHNLPELFLPHSNITPIRRAFA